MTQQSAGHNGRGRLPVDAVEKYCTTGCNCEHCVSVRKGEWPRQIMCSVKWDELPLEQRLIISESVND